MTFQKALGFAAVAALIGFAGTALRPSAGTLAQMQSMGTMATQSTASYNVVLNIEPATTMLTPDQAQGAMMGEVMVSMPDSGMMSPSMTLTGAQPGMGGSDSSMMMTTTDNGQPVNHHLEIHVASKSSGTPATDVTPQISITSDATGETRSLNVLAMYDIQAGQSDLHYGNNIYLPDGSYSVTVMAGSDTAQFSQVMVSGGMGLAGDSTGMMGGSMGMMGGGDPMQMPGH